MKMGVSLKEYRYSYIGVLGEEKRKYKLHNYITSKTNEIIKNEKEMRCKSVT